MQKENDTEVLERDSSDLHRPMQPRISMLPLWVAGSVAVVVLFIIVALTIGKTRGEKKSGVMKATYSARSLLDGPPEIVSFKEIVPVKEMAPVKTPKFNHVIFRLGDNEIFRFTYEDGGEDMRYSFEVREGGS